MHSVFNECFVLKLSDYFIYYIIPSVSTELIPGSPSDTKIHDAQVPYLYIIVEYTYNLLCHFPLIAGRVSPKGVFTD